MSRFDYVAYDKNATVLQVEFKIQVSKFENLIDSNLCAGRAKSLAITKLEECYMWIGKQIRDDQIARNGSAPLQEEINNS